ncbi:MAG: nicotinate-nucleotide--dimethylbenzimidazole phosphoribosyltransferase [Gammaproteobacteria bacterium]|nr:nicotinate-nucleotide--dimethylbenzimidazole phosphoribosyltransferase [Gammaproteobacteria bacterium]
MNIDWIYNAAARLNHDARNSALARQQQLTKPPGSLGVLETLAVNLAAMQANIQPQVDNVHITIFAADHGIAAQGVSAFPQIVTTEMIKNFARGGAAICVLARELNATLKVVNLGTIVDPGPLDGVIDRRIAPSTKDFSQQPAMTSEQLAQAIEIGREAAKNALATGAQLFIAGEMGIANTSAATAIACALLNKSAKEMAGPGTGLDEKGLAHKISVLDSALALHQSSTGNALDVLRCLGGFEIAAICGAYIFCAQNRVPVLIDGFIASAAALCATRICDNVSDWFFFAHASAEPGHRLMMKSLNANPLLSFGMRLGEGSGAAVAVPIIRLACALHHQMATFEQAGVTDKTS